MTASWAGLPATCLQVEPFVLLKLKGHHLILSHLTLEPAKENHFVVSKHTSMVISPARRDGGHDRKVNPFFVGDVKPEHFLVRTAIAGNAANKVSEIAILDRCVVGQSAWCVP